MQIVKLEPSFGRPSNFKKNKIFIVHQAITEKVDDFPSSWNLCTHEGKSLNTNKFDTSKVSFGRFRKEEVKGGLKPHTTTPKTALVVGEKAQIRAIKSPNETSKHSHKR